MLKILANLLFSENDLHICAYPLEKLYVSQCKKYKLQITDIFYEIKRISIFVLYIFRIYSNNSSLS